MVNPRPVLIRNVTSRYPQAHTRSTPATRGGADWPMRRRCYDLIMKLHRLCLWLLMGGPVLGCDLGDISVPVSDAGSGGRGDSPDAADDVASDAADALAPDAPAPDKPASDAALPGARLRRRIRVGDDGSQEFLGLYDQQLQTTCSYERAEDGARRCLPDSEGGAVVLLAALFTDPACKEALAYDLPACGPPRARPQFARESQGCGGLRLYTLGAQVPPGPRYRYDVQGACVLAPAT